MVWMATRESTPGERVRLEKISVQEVGARKNLGFRISSSYFALMPKPAPAVPAAD